jgi:hypothetical protein
MKKSVWMIVAVVFMALVVPSARADSISSGTLSFTLDSCCVAPTSGSFTYDATTNQFLNFSVIWDGMTFDLSHATQTTYLAMSGAIPTPLFWTAACEPSTVNPTVPCDGLLDFQISAGDYVSGFAVRPLMPSADLAVGGGKFAVSNLVAVPEPGTLAFVLMGIAGMILKRLAAPTVRIQV